MGRQRSWVGPRADSSNDTGKQQPQLLQGVRLQEEHPRPPLKIITILTSQWSSWPMPNCFPFLSCPCHISPTHFSTPNWWSQMQEPSPVVCCQSSIPLGSSDTQLALNMCVEQKNERKLLISRSSHISIAHKPHNQTYAKHFQMEIQVRTFL